MYRCDSAPFSAGPETQTRLRVHAHGASSSFVSRGEKSAKLAIGVQLHREYSRSDEATQDTTCRCYLRGPDGVSGLTPSGTWSTAKASRLHQPLPPRSSTSRMIRLASSTASAEASRWVTTRTRLAVQ